MKQVVWIFAVWVATLSAQALQMGNDQLLT